MAYESPLGAVNITGPPNIAPWLSNMLEGLPAVFRQAQIDQSKVDAMNQLKNVQLVGPDGQINPNAYGAMAQILAATNPQAAADFAALGQQQQDITQAQNVGGQYFGRGAPGAPGPSAPGAPGPGAAPGADASGISSDQLLAGIKQAETGGERNPYGSVTSTGTGHRVYGAYQIYDDNIGPWTQEALGRRMTPAQFLADPQAQDQVARYKLGEYTQKYGTAGAARAWLAGEGGMNNPRAADKYGSTPYGYAAKVLGYARQSPEKQARGEPPRGVAAGGTLGDIFGGGTKADPYVVSAAEQARLPKGAWYVPKSNPSIAPRQKNGDAAVTSPAAEASRPPPASAAAAPLTEEALLRSPQAARSPAGQVGMEFGALEAPPPSAAGGTAIYPTGVQTTRVPPVSAPAPAMPGAAPTTPPAAPLPSQPAAPELIHPRPLPPGYTRWQDAVDDMRRDGNRLTLSRSPPAQRMGQQLLHEADNIEKTHAPQEVMPGRPIYDPETRTWSQTPVAPGGRGSTVQLYQQQAPAIVGGIEDGTMPPDLKGLFGARPFVEAEAARRGVNLTQRMLEWQRAQKMVASLNGPQSIRFVGLANSVQNVIGRVEELSDQLKLSGITPLNRGRLEWYRDFRGNTPEGQMATAYLTQVGVLKEEFANLANGGYAPTEPAWRLANQQVNENYGVEQLHTSLGEIKRAINYRLQAMPGMGEYGPGAANPYMPGATQPQAPVSGASAAPSAPGGKVQKWERAPDGTLRPSQ
jgi:hypothetical protein